MCWAPKRWIRIPEFYIFVCFSKNRYTNLITILSRFTPSLKTTCFEYLFSYIFCSYAFDFNVETFLHSHLTYLKPTHENRSWKWEYLVSIGVFFLLFFFFIQDLTTLRPIHILVLFRKLNIHIVLYSKSIGMGVSLVVPLYVALLLVHVLHLPLKENLIAKMFQLDEHFF